MRTWLTERLGVAVPVICAPMAGVAGGRLALAVSRAGGLGMIGVGDRTTPRWIDEQAAEAASLGVPFGVGLQAWALPLNPGQAESALASGAGLVSLSYGSYAPYVEAFTSAGMVVATAVGTTEEALEAQDSGVDLIIARGSEGGGHGRDDVSTLALLQSVLDVVRTPVVAAGGIATSRGLAAVIAAGAAGAWVGTAFTATTESMSTPAARDRLVAAQDVDTVYTRVFDIAAGARWPREFGERALRNEFSDTWAGREAGLETDPDASRVMAEARLADDVDVVCLDAGQGVGLLRGISSAADVVAEFAGADAHLRRAAEGSR